MRHSKELLLVPIEELAASVYNVRRLGTGAGAGDDARPGSPPSGSIEELAALIASQGLLQHLIVTEEVLVSKRRSRAAVAPVTRFGVVAGERRRRALVLLQRRGVLPAGFAVPCELVSAERALEISLAENSGREPMHPADEFEAFHALVQQGLGVEEVAARFGVSTLVVQRRLRLAAASPRLLALYRAGGNADQVGVAGDARHGLGLDQLMALCLSTDHAAQERAWFEAQPWERTPAALRKRLTEGEALAHQSALARFVGLQAYEAAGGAVRRDLFDEGSDCWVCDAELLRGLAIGKLDDLAESARAEGWAWVEARIELDSAGLRAFDRCTPGQRTPDRQEACALAELDARSAELDRESEAMADGDAWDNSEAERISLEEQDIAVRRKGLLQGLQVWSDQDRARAGVIVTVGRDGSPEVIRGLLKPGAARGRGRTGLSGRALGKGRADAGRPAAHGMGADANARRVPATLDWSDVDPAVQAATMASTATPLSGPLLRRLAAHRTAALQAVLAESPKHALVALTHSLALQVFERHGAHRRSALQLRALPPRHELLRAADDLPAGRAWVQLEAQRSAWLGRLPQDDELWLTWLAALPQDELLALLALCSASLALVCEGAGQVAAELEAQCGLDMRAWWEPTGPGYLQHVSKAQVIQAVQQAQAASGERAGQGVGDDLAKLKKPALVAHAVSALAGRGWLPPELQARQPLRLREG